eukprot:7699853-Pyramimonas_sp.AAC.1
MTKCLHYVYTRYTKPCSASGANGVRGGGIYLDQGAMASREEAYALIRGQWCERRGNIPAVARRLIHLIRFGSAGGPERGLEGVQRGSRGGPEG